MGNWLASTNIHVVSVDLSFKDDKYRCMYNYIIYICICIYIYMCVCIYLSYIYIGMHYRNAIESTCFEKGVE